MFDILIANFDLLIRGAWMTLLLSVASAVLATVLGVLLALIQLFAGFLIRIPAEIFLYIMRGVPLLVMLFAIYYILPYIGIDLPPIAGGILVIGFYFSAFMTEVFRGAIQAVPRGQWDAARALGMYGHRTLLIAIIPQAIRLAGPPYINTSIMLIKGTSLVSIIGIWELTLAGQQIVERTLAAFQIFGGVALIYFVICFSLSCYGRYLERKALYAQ
ncbi:amino acid ABC transporter permease [Roseovarius sp.]|uniref:amino acid ABC transporter permease n=1 Tax=Roseovarius sp. TaxID=1486281 RepID=UPI003569FD38